MNSSKNLNKMIKISLLAAIAVVLMYFDFPIIPAFPWLKIDLSEVPALMGGFAYGPVAGGIIVILKVFLRFLIKGTETGFCRRDCKYYSWTCVSCSSSLDI